LTDEPRLKFVGNWLLKLRVIPNCFCEADPELALLRVHTPLSQRIIPSSNSHSETTLLLHCSRDQVVAPRPLGNTASPRPLGDVTLSTHHQEPLWMLF